jgi:hypothetical protein
MLVKIAFAAVLLLLAIAPAVAAGSSALHVGLVITGSFSPQLVGAWESRPVAMNAVYRFQVHGTSGQLFELVSVPAEAGDRPDAPTDAAAGCQFRLTGAILSVEKASGKAARAGILTGGLTPTYQMRYQVRSAEAVISSASADGCRQIAASYVSDVSAGERTLFLTKAADGTLIDSVAGTQYTRASN